MAAAALTLVAGHAWADYGVEIDAPSSVRKLLKQNLDLARFAKRDDISEEQFGFLVTAAPQQVRELVRTAGYFSPVVSTDLQGEGDKRTVVVRVDPGPQTTVSGIDLRFTGPVGEQAPERETATRLAFSLAVGDPFSQKGWDDAKNAALKVLQAERYLGARISRSQATIDPRLHQAQLAVLFDSGPTFTLGPVHIAGVKRYPEWIIEHVNPLRVGEIYRATRVNELQRQVQNTPYYASVAVDVQRDASHPLEAPVSVRVNEYQFHSVRGGVGYSTDNGARIEGAYSYNNLFGRAWVFSAQGRLEQRSRYGSLQVSMPPDSKSYVNSALASYTSTDSEDTRIYSLRAGVQRTRTREFYDYTYSILYYQDRLEQNTGGPTVSRALVPAFAWVRRNVDDPVFPRKGNLVGVEAGFAIKGLLSDATFARVYAHGRQYFPIGREDLLLLRVELGGVFTNAPSAAVPATLLFRAGGSNSIRGYSYQSIGNNVDGSVLPTKFLVTGGAEYQHWFTHDWGAAMFYDIGTATDVWRERRFFSGVGLGARWRSPVGPVNVDIGYGLQNRGIRPYLTLGIAF